MRSAQRRPPWAFVAQLILVVWTAQSSACHRAHSVTEELYRVEGTAITLPKVGDWLPDATAARSSAASGGLMMRLVQKSSVPGSPRIEVLMEPPNATPTLLDAYLTRNLRDMGALEAKGAIRILHVDQQEIRVGSLPAWRVHHEFTTGAGASQVSLYQASTFFVMEGRGVTLSAAGRVELFHPLANSIAQILDGVAIDARPRAKKSPTPAGVVDLGTLGGPSH